MMLLRDISRTSGVRRLTLLAMAITAAGTANVVAQYHYRVVPGRGQKVTEVGDDFEDPEWAYVDNAPKSSTNIDSQDRLPAGISKNQRVYESTYRGQPDSIKRVETPAGGLRGSKWSLALRSKQTGAPGYPSRKQQQDDLLINVTSLLEGPVPVTQSPSVVVRVVLPPVAPWGT